MQKLILLILLANTAKAIIPTIDQHILASDVTTMTNYASTMGSYISRISEATTVAKQIEQLHSLQQLQSAGTQICALCSQSDTQNLQNYINNINDDLCSQFAWSMQNITGVAQNITNINEIIAQFQVNPQAAALALQRSVVQTATSTQNTLAQMQMLMAQQGQKQLAEQKLEKQNNNDVYIGFSQSGL